MQHINIKLFIKIYTSSETERKSYLCTIRVHEKERALLKCLLKERAVSVDETHILHASTERDAMQEKIQHKHNAEKSTCSSVPWSELYCCSELALSTQLSANTLVSHCRLKIIYLRVIFAHFYYYLFLLNKKHQATLVKMVCTQFLAFKTDLKNNNLDKYAFF